MKADSLSGEVFEETEFNEADSNSDRVLHGDHEHQAHSSDLPPYQQNRTTQEYPNGLNDNYSSRKRNDLVVEGYNFNEATCLKTSERILDDLRCDPLFLLKGENGIMSSPTRFYSKSLSHLVHNFPVKYETVFWKTEDPELGSYQTTELDNDYYLASFTGLLVPKSSKANFTNEKIFHYSLKIKFRKDRVNVRNTFYGFHDEQLKENDKLFIDAQTIVEDSNNLSEEGIETLLKSLPTIIDSANFISRETGTVIRLELYPAILQSNDLETFSITEIQTRIATFNSQEDTVFDKVGLTPAKCFQMLNTALIGALRQRNNTEIKSIDLQNTKLQVVLDVDVLMNKFFFSIYEKDGRSQMTPVKFLSLGEYRFVCEDYFKRAITETVYLNSITKSDDRSLQLFSKSLGDVFEAIQDFDCTLQSQYWNYWDSQYYSEWMIMLSVCPYYSDQYIQHICEQMINFDSIHKPLYIDALFDCASSRNSERLPFYVALLKDKGSIGFTELKSSYVALGYTNVSTCEDLNQITDEDLLTTYKNQLILATNKYETATLRENLEKIAKFRESNFLKEYLNTEAYFDVDDAYNLLDISPSVDDSTMIMFYDLKLSENQGYDINVARAFYTIAVNRKSVILMDYIEKNLPQFLPQSLSLPEAYSYIGCTDTADDIMVVRIFQERLNKDAGAEFPVLWTCLKIVSNSRKSKILEGFLSTGMIESTYLQLDQSPAGLNNIGNTCYLNSLLQYYFVIKPLRDYILNFNEVFSVEEYEKNEKYTIRRIGGRTVGLKETERSYQFMYQLRDLYYQLIHENNRCVTPSRELAYLAFSPISFEVEFEEDTENMIDINTDKNNTGHADLIMENTENTADGYHLVASASSDVIDLTGDQSEDREQVSSMKSLISIDSTEKNPQTVKKKKTAAVCKISADQFESAFEIGSQQDVTECISNVLTQIESAMKPEKLDSTNEQLDMIKEFFYGKTKQRLVPVDEITKKELPDANVRTKLESFLNLIVNIGDHPKDIYDALDTYFTEDLIKLEDGEVKRSLTITELPKILQIQIQRVQFDRVRLMPVKSNDPIPFSEKIYMDRYLETDNQTIITKRQEIFDWRRRVEELNKRRDQIQSCNEQGLTTKEVLKATRDYLQSEAVKELGINIDNNTLEVLDKQIQDLDDESASINSELEELQSKISRQFEGFNDVGYSIFGIFIHRGQASYGHYFIYIRDPKTNIYRKYNDEIVSEVSLEEIFNFSDSNTATPYYLAFIKDELADQITPLQRDILINESLDELSKFSEDID